MTRLTMVRARALAVAATLLTVAVATAACGGSSASKSGGGGGGHKPRIYMLWPSSEVDGYIQQQNGARAAIAELGGRAQVTIDAGTSRAVAGELMRKIDSAVTQQYDVIAINAGAVGAQLTPAVKRAEAQGIKVLTFDQTVPGVKLASFIEFDGEQDGMIMCEYMKSKLPAGGQVGIIDCYAENPLIKAMDKGIGEGLAGSKVQVVAHLDAQCDPNRSRTAAEDMMTAHPQLKGLFTQWDVQALGAMPAVKAHGEPFVLVGGGAYKEALALMEKSDLLDATTNAHFPEFGRTAVETAVAVAEGKPVQPTIRASFDIVTKDDAAKVLAEVNQALQPAR